MKRKLLDVWIQYYKNQYDINIKVGYFDAVSGPSFLHSLRQPNKKFIKMLNPSKEYVGQSEEHSEMKHGILIMPQSNPMLNPIS